MKRRNFLKSLSAYSAPLMIGGVPVNVAKPLGIANFLNGNSDRILVLIQLNGGNDGLNTVLQLDNYDVLSNLRGNILIPENQGLGLTATHALHPAMTGIRDLYDQGMLKIIQNVGYPDQNRSHFRSTDIWTTASSSDEFLDTGWLGRHLETAFPGYPADYPNDDCPDPLAITIGNFVSETCQGTNVNLSIAVGNLDQIVNLDEPGQSNLPDNCYGNEMEFLIESIQKTNAYASRLTEAAENGVNMSSNYIDGDGFAEQMMTTARMISGGLQTQIYIVSIGGFDTHADQVVAEDPLNGIHNELWNSVSSAISAFFEDMTAQGYGDKILCMTYSEFGRQIRSNASLGTDHGTAAPLFIFGNCVDGGIIGDNIPIPSDVDQQAGTPMQYDFRDVYGTVLQKWFDVDELSIKEQLYDGYQALNIFSDGCLVSAFDTPEVSETAFNIWPNPARSIINISAYTEVNITAIEIYNTMGGVVQLENNPLLFAQLNISKLMPGQYFLRLTTNRGYVVKPFIKI